MSRAPGVCTRVTRGSAARRSQFRAAFSVDGRAALETSATTTSSPAPGETASGDEPVAAVVAGPAQDEDGAVPDPAGGIRDRARGGGNGRAGVLHEPLAGDPERLRAQVGTGHRLGADRRSGGRRGPALPKRTEIHRQDSSGSSAGKGAGRSAERAGAFTAPASVAERYAVGSRASVGSDGWRSARPSRARPSRATCTAALS